MKFAGYPRNELPDNQFGGCPEASSSLVKPDSCYVSRNESRKVVSFGQSVNLAASVKPKTTTRYPAMRK